MGLVDDDQLRAGAQELGAPAVLLDVIGGDDGDRVAFEDALAGEEVALETGGGAGEDQRGVEVELVDQGALPFARRDAAGKEP